MCPQPTQEVAWADSMGLMDDDTHSSNVNSGDKGNNGDNGYDDKDDEIDKVAAKMKQRVGSNQLFIISESESGTTTAERIQVALHLPGNGMSPQLRNKYLSNVMAKEAGLDVVRQVLAHTWMEASDFITDLWGDSSISSSSDDDGGGNTSNHCCVVKPYRGVASDGVFCCNNIIEAQCAFDSLIGRSQYGGGINDAVLIQEYAEGVEYAVDTVARDGRIKVIAIWKYSKFPANGAPFVYQCSELVSSDGTIEAAVCDYCIEILKAQKLCWGPTHTEIKYTLNGPRLMEINARWHAQDFVPITRRCLGRDAVACTLDSFFDEGIAQFRVCIFIEIVMVIMIMFESLQRQSVL